MVLRRWTLRQQLTILTVLFLGFSGLALWLVIQLFESLEGTVIARNQRELASANTRLIKLFWESRLDRTQIPNARLNKSLQSLSTDALANFPRVEGGFYLLGGDRLLGYAFPTHGGPVPKTDIPPAEQDSILQLTRQATSQGLPQELVLRPKLDILVLRADPLPLWGAVWTMKRMPRIEDGQPKILSGLIVVGILIIGVWTFAIAVQLQTGVQRLQDSLKAMEVNPKEQIPPLPAEMGLLGTAINTMQSRRQDLEQRLQRVGRLASLGQMVAGVAHEVRNPLASMRLNLQYTQRQLQKQEITNLPIASLLEQVERLESLVQRLLYFDRNQQEIPSLTSLEAIACESIALLRLKAEECQVELVYHPPAQPLEQTSLRRRELGQVLVNLILNAIQASPQGGEVSIGVTQERNYLVAWVEDRGQGLSTAEKEQIFVPFYSTKPEGTGLGLAISHEIVTRNAGYIDVQSQPGCTRFSIYLPVFHEDSKCNGKNSDS
ncbi:histidine kinase [Nostoc linckia z18]|uniref:histidine kinase n=2 Tax=Nostoc linckia TaxID=92942 RepID=A0A9Q5ZDB2_NOSLI|nr:ATP-binding protein [Nostoc linckia]PHK40852.1 histidine kinase [Nostoc linckia z15]PHK47580.1 histidine kinase [Nostoc linckia z16]PHJ61169.1 histidine kinase [Nostoc linckia z1]PHJ62323.1 histidine kinase [Nostoc linckia z3]PHJ69016.1 histidine kinase [Nostoc linckia z2]